MQEEEFTLGKTTFRQNFKKEVYPCLHPNNIDLIVRSDRWQVTLNNSWIMIFPSIKETEAKYLHVMHPYSSELPPPPVLDLIGNSSFKLLLKLELERNKIISIQNLCWVEMDNLEVLSLPHNFIMNLKPMNKTKFPSLQKIYLGNNKCHNIQISRAKTKSIMVRLEISREGLEPIKLEDPRMLVKLQPKRIDQLYISCNSEKIFKENVKEQLGKRFGFSRINWKDPNDRNND